MFSAIGDIFSGVQQKRAAAEAVRMINESRMLGVHASESIGSQGRSFLAEAGTAIDSAERYDTLLSDMMNSRGMGFSASDEIALKDAQRMMNENLVGTGNLRSGASVYGNVELARRAAADASTRSFDRFMQMQRAGAEQSLNRAGIAGGVGERLTSVSSNLLAQAMGLSTSMAKAEMQKGSSIASIIGAFGGGADMAVDKGLGMMMGGMGGGGLTGALGGMMTGGSQMAQMNMMSKLFAK